MKVRFHPDALAEMLEAADHYEQLQPMLGVRFANAVTQAIERIQRDPQAWPLLGDDIRRCLTRVFPYGVIYAVETEFILVLAVTPLARAPGYWSRRQL